MRRATLLVIVALCGLALGATPLGAVTDRTPVAGVLVWAEEKDPGECRANGNAQCTWPFRTMQVRGAQALHWWEGDAYIHGTNLVTYNFVSTWVCDEAGCKVTGQLWGTDRWEPDGFDGGWDGTFSFKITSFDEYGFSYSGKAHYQGYGELSGKRLVLDVVTDGTVPPWKGSHTVTGYVFTPGDK